MSSDTHAADPAIFLVDNGSLEPAPTLALRRLARELSRVTGRTVEPVSLLHSSGVPAETLDGVPAEILEPAIACRAAKGTRDFLILPAFIGPSRALTGYIPERVAALRSRFAGLRVGIADPLAHPDRPDSVERLAGLVADNVSTLLDDDSELPKVVLVDHGSPAREVVALRDRVTEALKRRLAGRAESVRAASMERRPGPEYDFCDPLLATCLDDPQLDRGRVIVAMLFLSPGRHAGPMGDVARICAEAGRRHPNVRIEMTRLLGAHPGLVELLAERLRASLPAI
jgi:sirohydrochlorin ferrochelatase